MWIIAGIADLVSFIPIPIIAGVVGDMIAFIGFSAIGADVKKGGLFSTEQIGITAVTMLLEVPLGMLPLWTFRVIIYKWQTRESKPWMQGGWTMPEEEEW